jgi:hypothetical protein
MKTAGHKELYARDVLTLNEAALAKVSTIHYTIVVSLYDCGSYCMFIYTVEINAWLTHTVCNMQN